MKKLMIGLAVAAMSAVPAFAISSNAYDARAQYNSMDAEADAVYAERSAYVEPGYDAYAQAPDAMMVAPLAGPPPVYSFGEYRGTDPDPFIRQHLMSDPSQSQY